MKVPWTEHKTNEEILKMVATERETSASVELTQTRHSHSKQLFHGGQISVFLQGGSKSFIRCL